jgi:hypothetical protein
LRWKFKQDETSNYVLDRAIDGVFDFNGQQINFSFAMTFDITWKVTAVAEDGTGDLTQTVDRIQFTMQSPIGGELKWDSTEPTPDGNPIWERMGAPLKALLGAPVTMKVTSQGKVSDIKFSDELQKFFDEQSTQRRMNLGGGVSADSIKEMIERAFLHLPDEAVAEDTKWEQQFATVVANAGTQFTDVSYSVTGMEEKDGQKLVKIAASTELSFKPNEGQNEAEIDISEQEGSGELIFDAAAGKTVSQSSKQKMTMEIVAGEREFIQEIDESIELKQGKSPPPAEKKEGEEKSEEGAEKADEDSKSSK